MKKFKGNSIGIIAGTVAGAVLTALVIAMVFGLGTGIAGAFLLILIIAVAVLFGWMVALNQRIQRRNHYEYLRGYREGLAKKTLIIQHPMCRCKIIMPEHMNIP